VDPAAIDFEKLSALREQVASLRDAALRFEARCTRSIVRVPEAERASARNLVHYLALRQHDLRNLQRDLATVGLSSLGRLEGHALATLEAVLAILDRLVGHPHSFAAEAPVGLEASAARLVANTHRLLGPPLQSRSVRVMVTLPAEVAEREDLARSLCLAGMSVARINCAHDDPRVWAAMVASVRSAAAEVRQECRILFDLAGPKVRTGPLRRGPGILRWRPVRDESGRTLRPARLWLPWSGERPPGSIDAVLPVRRLAGGAFSPGDTLELTDLPGRRRRLTVVLATEAGLCVEADRGARVQEGTEIRAASGEPSMVVAQVATAELTIRLSVGDRLILRAGSFVGEPERRDCEGHVVWPGQIGCTLPEVFPAVAPGHRVHFDDGKLSGVVRRCDGETIEVEIVASRGGTVALKGDRGINLPDTRLPVGGLTPKDLEDIDFVARHGDLVGLSFVRTPADLETLFAELDARGAGAMGVMLKIETKEAFERLPELLLRALARPPIGVMVARGDLGVELGFERLAEVQEEILWLCEASHAPVIWATQVLEAMTKRGMPSRAEVTDAAMSGRAECVMLNKGPRVVDAVRFLDDVLRRMEAHQEKKTSRLRKLSITGALVPLPHEASQG
jgi:pyruvate kinase